MTSPPATTSGGRELAHPAREEIRLEQVLHALADPLRLGVVRALASAPEDLPCGVFALPVSKSTCTHHFRVLRESGVIRQVYRGTAKMNALRRADLDHLFPGLLDGVLSAAQEQAGREREDGPPRRTARDRREPRTDPAG
ncbi:helix-turn-helix domain-containing protein [Streptomyces sp. DSM 44917]|uniref:Helix-turn-helix domain-containing protein n=1 Tax=Streptomyces boetiae TaxID=3075541 RepID=A0ABU2LE93_9ACTN|nr:helix-turn-helix domain-containing protein [Streptomyces sp. DSM 44917]MDT0309917.1 helix-turn-helix domain-containing protein [Streptomyces sp. DSM 44917]